MTIKRLIEKYVIENEYKDKIYKIYSNNQISLKIIRLMKSNNDQTRLRRIRKVCETIRSRDANLKLRWISKHKKFQSNEDANIVTRNCQELGSRDNRKLELLTKVVNCRYKTSHEEERKRTSLWIAREFKYSWMTSESVMLDQNKQCVDMFNNLQLKHLSSQ